MKVSVIRQDLSAAMQRVQYSSSSKGIMPILSGVKIETADGELVLHSTDLESYTTTRCAANVEEEGTCVVSLKVFSDFLKDSDDEKINMITLGNEMVLEGYNSTFKLFTMPPEDFPSPPNVAIPLIEELELSGFLPAVQRVSRAASRDDKRPTLMGILLELEEGELRMVSTDSYRLAMQRLGEGYKVLEAGQYIIPASSLVSLTRMAARGEKTSVYKDEKKEITVDASPKRAVPGEKVNVYRDENRGQVRFDLGSTDLIIRLIEGKFPKYGQFIPESMETTLEMGKDELQGALKRVSLIGSTIKMAVRQGETVLSSESREVGEGSERLPSEYNGEEMEIAFNHRFLEDGITSLEGEKVVFSISEPLKPGAIREKDSQDFIYIIMPIRI